MTLSKVVGIKEAAALTGLSAHELRAGAKSGKYPAMRAGGPHGRLLFDIERLFARMQELMEANMKAADDEDKAGQVRKIEA